jgi:hypothetical protein
MQIIIAREKHGDYYLDASTPEQWARSALKLLTDRWKEGYYYHEPKEPKEPEGLLPREEIEALPEPYKREAGLLFNRHIRNRRSYKEEKRLYDEIKYIVETQDTGMITYRNGRVEPRAWRILDDRGDHEYEGVELEDVAQP